MTGSVQLRDVIETDLPIFFEQQLDSEATQMADFLLAARPLYAHVAKHNIASRRVLEKCRFIVSGEDSYFSEALGKSVEEYILILNP